MFDVQRIRLDFPILKTGLIYLDNAASSLTPEQVLQAELEYYHKFRANIHRGLHRPSTQASDKYDEAREKVARFINAEKDEIVFTKNATEGINLVANAIEWKRDDVIETTVFEHHSNLLPWLKLSKKGVKTKINQDYDSFSKSKLIAVGHVSNVLGSIAPVERIAREKGDALLLVDAAQSAPHFALDVKKLGCDFLAFSAHKMLGPTGVGALYIRRDLQAKIYSPFLGGGTIRAVSETDYELTHFPESWEAGTPNIAGAIGFGAAIDYLKKLGMENVHAHTKKLAQQTAEALRQIEKAVVYGDKSVRNAIVSFNVEGMPAHDVAAMLDESARICVRSGHHCAMPLMKKLGCNGTVRASFYVYNTEQEAEKLIEALKQIIQLA